MMSPENSKMQRHTDSEESDMYARAMVIKVSPGCDLELTRTFEQEVIPQFRKEKDFRGLLAFTVPDGTEALSVSLWDQKENSGGVVAQSFAALTALARVALGKPAVQVCEVGDFPLHRTGQTPEQVESAEPTADLRIYQSALHSFNVVTTCGSKGRGFPLVWCLMNSFSSLVN
jgi:hypothetical protein